MHIGISLAHFSASQAAFYAIKFANKLFKTEHDCTLFYRDLMPHCMEIQAGCLTLSEIFGFKGTLITTSLYDTEFAIKAVGEGKRIFYIWDLEFLRNEKNFKKHLTIFRNPGILLAARSQSHSDAIENYCNRKPDMIVKDFNFECEIQ